MLDHMMTDMHDELRLVEATNKLEDLLEELNLSRLAAKIRAGESPQVRAAAAANPGEHGFVMTPPTLDSDGSSINAAVVVAACACGKKHPIKESDLRRIIERMKMLLFFGKEFQSLVTRHKQEQQTEERSCKL